MNAQQYPGYPESRLNVKEAAEQGDVNAMVELGLRVYRGHGVQKDPVTACKWFAQAAQKQHAYAKFALGRCIYSGEGYAQDHAAAYSWFLVAAQQGLVVAMDVVADMCANGDGVQKSDSEAVAWYRKAADNNDPYAMTQLGLHLREGKGIAWSEAEAMQWFTKAATQHEYGSAEGAMAAGYEYGLGQAVGQGVKDEQKALYWMERAAQHGCGACQVNLGIIYESGEDALNDGTVIAVPKDLERAKYYYSQAAANPDPETAKWGRKFLAELSHPSVTSSKTDSSGDVAAVAMGVIALLALSAVTSSSSSGTSSTPEGSDDPSGTRLYDHLHTGIQEREHEDQLWRQLTAPTPCSGTWANGVCRQ